MVMGWADVPCALPLCRWLSLLVSAHPTLSLMWRSGYVAIGLVGALHHLEDGEDNRREQQIMQLLLPVNQQWRKQMVMDDEGDEER